MCTEQITEELKKVDTEIVSLMSVCPNPRCQGVKCSMSNNQTLPKEVEKEPYKHLNLKQYIPDNLQSGITDEDLQNMETKDLNRMLKRKGTRI